MGGRDGTLGTGPLEKVERVDAQSFGDPFHGFECEVPLASFEAPHICPVEAHVVGERLLAELASEAIPAQVGAKVLLQLAIHRLTRCRRDT